jgi:HAD superfamily hydrolase (TIGR01509 family)
MKALIFDCDGVLVDTERDGHRVAFNRAFRRKGLDIEWSIGEYGELLRVPGGKERMRHWFETRGWPPGAADHNAFVKDLHRLKTTLFQEIIEAGELPLRSGVARLVDEAIAREVSLAVCSTSNERAVNTVVDTLLGAERKAKFRAILAGDIVSRKKPAPEIYELARERLSLSGKDCLVIEDSRVGLLAAKGAGMYCLVTTNGYTALEDFSEADRVVPELGDPPGPAVSMDDLHRLVRDRGGA